jgi:hypothetical protein
VDSQFCFLRFNRVYDLARRVEKVLGIVLFMRPVPVRFASGSHDVYRSVGIQFFCRLQAAYRILKRGLRLVRIFGKDIFPNANLREDYIMLIKRGSEGPAPSIAQGYGWRGKKRRITGLFTLRR